MAGLFKFRFLLKLLRNVTVFFLTGAHFDEKSKFSWT